MGDDRRLVARRYLVGEALGRGGMSDVHLGTDLRLGRAVAIKFLKPSLAGDPAARARFRDEAQAASRMTHPTIVRVFDAGEEHVTDAHGTAAVLPYIVMEFVSGEVLRDIIRDKPLAPAEAVRVADGILTALEYSHRAGIVHRDIKPGNVMITPTGQVKVMDFGIARTTAKSTAAPTAAILGTASYFSPEQARGQTVDARSDLYSTGVVLFEMLTGRPLFTGSSALEVAHRHIHDAPPVPGSVNPAVPRKIDAVVLQALAKDRARRFQTAEAFRAALRAAAVPSTEVPSTERSARTGDTSAAAEDSPSRAASLRRGRAGAAWLWISVIALAVLAGLAAVGLWFAHLEAAEASRADTSQLDTSQADVSAAIGLRVAARATAPATPTDSSQLPISR